MQYLNLNDVPQDQRDAAIDKWFEAIFAKAGGKQNVTMIGAWVATTKEGASVSHCHQCGCDECIAEYEGYEQDIALRELSRSPGRPNRPSAAL